MRRGRVLVGFGWLVTVLGIASVSAGSKAAGPAASADPLPPPPRSTASPELLPLLAHHEAVFGRFIRPGTTAGAVPSEEGCSGDMVEVEGDYCPLTEQKCLKWLDPDSKLRCAEFEKAPLGARCLMPTQHKHFCVDRYEWPNRLGELPTYMASWQEAKASCESVGKRLCADTEWTLACEGPNRQPYPYNDGYARDATACNIDKPYIWPQPVKVYDPKLQGAELARLDQREPSGSRIACVSPYGVHDMVGNVDEWVVNVSQFGQPHLSGLKGGYWGPVRTRCRPMTTAHDEQFRYYQIGFRCCGDVHMIETGDAPLASRL